MKISLIWLCVLTVLMAGCSTQTATVQPTAAPTNTAVIAAATATTAPTVALAPTETVAGATATTAALTAADTPTPAASGAADTPTAAAAPSAEDTTPKVVAAANAFLATLDATQRATVSFDWTDSAQKARWSNLPEGLFSRAGLMWGNMTTAQQDAWLAVMAATLSKEGYDRVIAEWNGDEVLATQQGSGGQLLFGKKYYYIALIGTPSETDPWQWQWGGHHVTVNATIAGSNIALTPSFIGVQPATYTDSTGQTIRPLGDIEDTARALLASLDATQQGQAVLGTSTIDLVLGIGQDGKTIQSEGLPASAMTADQQALLLKLMGYYGNLLNAEDAASRMADLQSHLAETYFAWYGPTNGSSGYFRVTGPTVVIEFSPQGAGGGGRPGSTTTTSTTAITNADHIHGIYRDPTNDYGAGIVTK